MFRSLKRRGIAFCVTKPGTETDSTTKKVRHQPRSCSGVKTSASDRLAHFETIRLVYLEVSTSLQVETRIERLDARAIDEQMPAVESLRRADQCEG